MSNIIDSIQLSGVTYDIGGSGGVPESAFTAYTASTNSRISEDEEVTAAALNDLNESLSGKQETLVAGSGITISGNVISATGGGSITIDPSLDSGSTNAVANSAITNAFENINDRLSEDEEVTAAGLNALNDKISPTVELTQAEYEALTEKDPNTYYIITDAQAGDLTQYWTSAQTNSAITAAVSGKQDTLISGTSIKTINNESILGSGNIDIQGGGKAVSAGTNISITTGETADTINCTLPISATTNSSILIGVSCSANREKSFVGGQGSVGQGEGSFAFGQFCKAGQWSIAVGNGVEANISPNSAAFGKYNKQNGGFYEPDSATTLFSVGNGNGGSASERHNAFEIRKNGDIYLNDGTNDVKLQDTITATAANTTALGGLKLVKLTQSEYDALSPNYDSNTLYVIT